MPPPLSSMHTAHKCIRCKAAHACTKQQIKSTKNNAITDGGVAGQTETDHLAVVDLEVDRVAEEVVDLDMVVEIEVDNFGRDRARPPT